MRVVFELTNEERRYFALPELLPGSVRLGLETASCRVFCYLEGNHFYKVIMTGDNGNGCHFYNEYQVNETLSEDHQYILPKKKGKPRRLTISSLDNIAGIGMQFCHNGHDVFVENATPQKTYYSSQYEGKSITAEEDLRTFVERWCDETTEEDLRSLDAFAAEERKHVKYREGDYFRFGIGRRLYGYGRILLDVDTLRKSKADFWDCYITKPLIVAAYRIATERRDIRAEELDGIGMFPSQPMMDNDLYYGTYEIIGHYPLDERKADYPINYGISFEMGDDTVYYQEGKHCLKAKYGPKFKWVKKYRDSAIYTSLHFNLQLLKACEDANSNLPYWNEFGKNDLRNPQNAEALKSIRGFFGI